MSILLNGLELFAIKPNKDTQALTQKWNTQLESWKALCIPKIRSNATDWPKMKENHIKATQDFFGWLESLGLLSEHTALIHKVTSDISKLLSKEG